LTAKASIPGELAVAEFGQRPSRDADQVAADAVRVDVAEVHHPDPEAQLGDGRPAQHAGPDQVEPFLLGGAGAAHRPEQSGQRELHRTQAVEAGAQRPGAVAEPERHAGDLEQQQDREQAERGQRREEQHHAEGEQRGLIRPGPATAPRPPALTHTK